MALSKAKVAAAVTKGFKAAGDLAFDCTLTRETPGVAISATEVDLGTLTADAGSKAISFTAGSVTGLGFAAGQTFRVNWVSGWPGHIEYTIASVSASTITVTEAIPDIAPVGRFEVVTVAAPAIQTAVGKALFDERPRLSTDYFGGLEIGPDDQIVWLQGLAFGPRQGDRVQINGTDRTVRWVDDVTNAGIIWQAVVR